MAPKQAEPWNPTTREEWTELFADGFSLAQSRRDETDAKAKAAADELAAKEAADAAANAKPSLAERLLGITNK